MTVDEQIEHLVAEMNNRSMAMHMLMDQVETADANGVQLDELAVRAVALARENVELGRRLADLHSPDHPIQKVQRSLEWHVSQLRTSQ